MSCAAPAEPPPRPPASPRGRESLLLFLLVAAASVGLGLGPWSHDQVDWPAIVALSHAYDAVSAEGGANLALIGFVEPPLPALLQVPVVAVYRGLGTSGLAAPLLGALWVAAAVVVLNALLSDLGLGPALRWPLCALFFLHPLTLSWAETGALEGLMVLLVLGLTRGLLRWLHFRVLRDLITASLFCAALVLTRYEALFIALAVAGLLAADVVQRRGGWAEVEGTLITFGLPAAYVLGIWIVLNWLIMGEPLYFWTRYFPADGHATAPAGWSLGLARLRALTDTVAFVPTSLAGLLWALLRRPQGRSLLPVAVLFVTPYAALWLAPGAFDRWVVAAQEQAPGLTAPVPELMAPSLALGCVLLAAMVADLGRLGAPSEQPAGRVASLAAPAGVAVLLVLGLALCLADHHPARPFQTAAFRGRPVGAASATSARAVAARLAGTPPAPGRLVVAGWPGFAITLYAGYRGPKVMLPDAAPPAQRLPGPPAGALLVRSLQSGASADPAPGWGVALGRPRPPRPQWRCEEWVYCAWPAVAMPSAAPERLPSWIP